MNSGFVAMKKNIFIDCQILQTDAFDRGMGKYCISLLSALQTNSKFTKEYNIYLVLNKNLALKTPNKIALNSAMPKSKKLLLDLPTNISEDINHKYTHARQTLTIEVKKIAKEGDVYLILAPFFVAFPAEFPDISYIKKASVVYDLIPYLVWHKMRIFPDDIYFRHYQLFIEADILLTISQAVKDDLSDIVGISKEKIQSINGGPFSAKISPKAFKLTERPYILCVSAPILHKNNKRAVRAFAQFNKANDNAYDLLITSKFDDITKQQLDNLSANIIFTGNVSDGILQYLYNNAESVLFPSLTEGLGLPVLEGVMHGKPIACSKIPVLMEISQDAFYSFDPTNIKQISTAILDSVEKKDFYTKKKKYKSILNKYTWERSADLAMKSFSKVNKQKKPKLKKTLKLYAPDPRSGNAEGKLAEKLYPSLCENFDVQVEFTGNSTDKEPAYLPYILENNNSKTDLLLVIGHVKKPKLDLPVVYVGIKKKKSQNIFRFIYNRSSKKFDLLYKVVDDYMYTPLGNKSYRFADNTGVYLKEGDICKQIISIFKERS